MNRTFTGKFTVKSLQVMKDLGTVPPVAVHLTPEQQRDLVDRIGASRSFSRAPQLRDFLRFIVERAIVDGGASINETEIGRLVLRTQELDFDPATDNIVRVQARHLRQKLAGYFVAEGCAEPVVLTIPKGTYVPKFEQREAGAMAVEEAPHRSPEPPAIIPGRGFGRLLLVAIGILGGVGSGWVVWHTVQRQPFEAQAAGSAMQVQPVWAVLAGTRRTTSIILSDSSVSVAQNLTRKPVTLSMYLSPAYPRDMLAGIGAVPTALVLSEITKHPYTSLNSAIVASRLQLSASRAGIETALRFPRDITIREFESENFVLIGSRRSVPWMELVEEELNFVLAGDPGNLDFYMINKAPKKGEAAVYRPEPDGSVTFASVALVPNGTGRGLIMCFQGLTGMANEAAEQLIDDAKNSPLAPLLKSVPTGSLPHIEILLRATGMGGTPVKTEVLATRIRGPSGVSR